MDVAQKLAGGLAPGVHCGAPAASVDLAALCSSPARRPPQDLTIKREVGRRPLWTVERIEIVRAATGRASTPKRDRLLEPAQPLRDDDPTFVSLASCGVRASTTRTCARRALADAHEIAHFLDELREAPTPERRNLRRLRRFLRTRSADASRRGPPSCSPHARTGYDPDGAERISTAASETTWGGTAHGFPLGQLRRVDPCRLGRMLRAWFDAAPSCRSRRLAAVYDRLSPRASARTSTREFLDLFRLEPAGSPPDESTKRAFRAVVVRAVSARPARVRVSLAWMPARGATDRTLTCPTRTRRRPELRYATGPAGAPSRRRPPPHPDADAPRQIPNASAVQRRTCSPIWSCSRRRRPRG